MCTLQWKKVATSNARTTRMRDNWRLSHTAFQFGRPRQRQESPGRIQGRAAVPIPRPARAESRARDRFHQTADAGRRKDHARFFQHPKLRPPVLPYGPFRNLGGGRQKVRNRVFCERRREKFLVSKVDTSREAIQRFDDSQLFDGLRSERWRLS